MHLTAIQVVGAEENFPKKWPSGRYRPASPKATGRYQRENNTSDRGRATKDISPFSQGTQFLRFSHFMIYWFSAERGHIAALPLRAKPGTFTRKTSATAGRRRQRRVRVEKFQRFYFSSFFTILNERWFLPVGSQRLRWSGRDSLCCWQDMEILLSCCISENMVYGHKTLSFATVLGK